MKGGVAGIMVKKNSLAAPDTLFSCGHRTFSHIASDCWFVTYVYVRGCDPTDKLSVVGVYFGLGFEFSLRGALETSRIFFRFDQILMKFRFYMLNLLTNSVEQSDFEKFDFLVMPF